MKSMSSELEHRSFKRATPPSSDSTGQRKRTRVVGMEEALNTEICSMRRMLEDAKPLFPGLFFRNWQFSLNLAQDGKRINKEYLGKLLPPGGATVEQESYLEHLNRFFNDFCIAYRLVSEARLPPSDFAKPSGWPVAQGKFDDLLCLRPTNRTGLPLSTLHDVFRQFLIQARSPLPERGAATTALRVATSLCDEMGDSFEDESHRSITFDACVQSLWSGWVPETLITAQSDVYGGKVDRILYSRKASWCPIIVREDMWEPGQSEGDVYLQATRDYQLIIHGLKDKAKEKSAIRFFLSNGAPVFLLCVLGPLLLVAGGFYDGGAVIVEPLGPAHYMLLDPLGQRERSLAQVLYALEQAVLRIENETYLQTSFSPGVPRLYTSCVLFASQADAQLTFDKRLESGPRRPMFCGAMTDLSTSTSPKRVLIKMVSGHYGTSVHRLLAERGRAPVLYGQRELEGGPIAYVMEDLGSDWVTLHDFSRDFESDDAGLKVAIRAALDEIVDIFHEEQVVHGDLRPNNIMIETRNGLPKREDGGGVVLKVIDFDWAGQVGEAYIHLS